MPIEKIVLNASPLIVLFKSRLENVLPDLFKDIVIPESVYIEVTGDLKMIESQQSCLILNGVKSLRRK